MATTAVKEKEKNFITETLMAIVRTKIAGGEIAIPANYSAENAVMAAYLTLTQMTDKNGKPIAEVCTKESIANAILEMVTQGLNPTKQQCYFIPYGNKLTMQRSYLGTIAITKRVPGVVDVKAYPVYENDVLEIGFDVKKGVPILESFKPALDHEEKKLIGAFAIILGGLGIIHLEYMTMSEIRASWNQGQMKGNSPAHKNFSGEMAKKTVVNRACKMYAKTSDDTSYFSAILAKEQTFDIDAEMHEHEDVVAETVEVEAVSEVTGEVAETAEDLQF